jgi:flagellar hook-associated protein 2
MATITSAGAGSGLDVSSLVTQLVAAERAPYDQRLSRADTQLTTEFSALSKLKAAMSSFQSALGALKDSDDFQKRAVTVSDEDAIAATATSAAAEGIYDIEVTQLAKASQLSSVAFLAGSTAVVGTGTLHLTMGDKTFNVTLDDAHKTLADVRDAINAAADNPGIRATLIKAQDGTRLVITGTATGTANAVKISTTGGDGGLAQVANDPVAPGGLTTTTVAQDAIVKISGYTVTAKGNVIDDAVDGLTLTLKQAEVGKVMTVSVANDTSSVTSNVQNFVSAYNVLANQMTSLRSYNAETKVAGPLLGDAMLRNLESQVRRVLSDPVAGATGVYQTLASLGVTTTSTGMLKLDSTRLTAALGADPTAATKVFSATGGVAQRLDKLLTEHLATDGDLAARDASIKASRKSLTDQKTTLDARMVVIKARYTKQFNALDSLLTQMQSTSAYLAKQLGTTTTG